MTGDASMALVELRSVGLSAQVDPLGAQLVLVRDEADRDLLWHGDPAWWGSRAPILFPVVGTLAGGSYRIGGQRYPLPRHGFARGRRFEPQVHDAAGASFLLRDDAATHAVYPFAFELEVAFRLEGHSLSCVATLRNTGDVPLPASLGFHPGFAWPLPYGGAREEHGIEFTESEPDPVRRLTAGGLLAPQPVETPVSGHHLALADRLFEPDVLILDRVRSRRLRYGVPGRRGLELWFPEARQLGIWTKPGAPFVCLEPWQGHADPDGYEGEFAARPGSFTVSPGAAHRHSLTLTLDPP